MPHYFFDFRDSALIRDDTGADYPNGHAARTAAVRTLSDIGRDLMPKDATREVSVVMRDQARRPIFTASLTLEAHWLDGDQDLLR